MKKEVKTDSTTVMPTSGTEIPPVQNNVVNQQTPANAMPIPEQQAYTAGNTPTSNDLNSQKSNILAKLKSFGVGPIIVAAVIAVVLIGGIIFSVASSSPKAVFKKAINKTYKEVKTTIDEVDKLSETYDFRENAILVNVDAKLNTNISDIEESGIVLDNLTVGGGFGLDYKNDVLEVSANVKGESESIDIKAQLSDSTALMSSSLLDDTIKYDLEDEVNFDEIKDAVKEIEDQVELDPEKYVEVIKIFKDGLINSLNSEYMEKEKEKIDVLDKSINATKYSYVIDEDAAQDFVKSMSEYLLENDEFAEQIEDLFGKAANIEKDNIEESLEELKDSAKDIEFEDKVIINFYTRGLFNQFAGISIEVDKTEYFTMFTDGDNYETTIDNHEEDEYDAFKLVITSEKNKKEHEVEVKYNGEKVAKATIKEFTDEVIDLTFEVTTEGETAKGEFYFSAKQEKKKITGEYKVRLEREEEYMQLSGSYGIESKDKLDKMSDKDAIDASEVDEDELIEKFEEMAEKDKVFESILTYSEELEKQNKIEELNLDYYNMSTIYDVETFAEVLDYDEGTIIYAGTKYPTAGTDAYDMFNNLVDVLTELDHYSYYVNETTIKSSEYQALLGNVNYTCQVGDIPTNNNQTEENTQTPNNETSDEVQIPTQTTPCAETPVIYLIENGEIVKAFRGTVSVDELKSALSDIGIN